MYHLDGADLVMTHYCMLGNQPRMKADPKSPANQLCFKFAGGSNLDPAKDKHMHEGTLTFIDDDHIEFSGVCWDGGICQGTKRRKLVRAMSNSSAATVTKPRGGGCRLGSDLLPSVCPRAAEHKASGEASSSPGRRQGLFGPRSRNNCLASLRQRSGQ